MRGLPAGFTARGAVLPDDLDAVADLYAACDRADVGFVDPSRAAIEHDWRAEGFDPAVDAVVIEAADGRLAAAGTCSWSADAPSDAFNRVHPERRGRGLGTWLIAWVAERCRANAARGGTPLAYVSLPATDAAGVGLLERHGYAHVRTFRHLEVDLPGSAPPVPAPEGISIRPVAMPDDLVHVYDVIESAFVGQFDYLPASFESRREEWLATPGFDPELFLLAWDGDRAVGAAVSAPDEGIGWIHEVAVLVPWRGRGIGEALLRATFSAFGRRGLQQARLNVDVGNATGAPRLYARVGMHLRREWLVFEKAFARG